MRFVHQLELGTASAILGGGGLETGDVAFEVELSPERELLHQPEDRGLSIHRHVALVEVVRVDPESGIGKRAGRRDPGDCGLGTERGRGELGAELARERDELADGCSGRGGLGRAKLGRCHDRPRQRNYADEADYAGPEHGSLRGLERDLSGYSLVLALHLG